jgi:hypothetical protein
MCIACKTYGKKQIVSKPVLTKALLTIKELYYNADEETLAHLDALTQRWLMGSTPKREPDVEDFWERSHR